MTNDPNLSPSDSLSDDQLHILALRAEIDNLHIRINELQTLGSLLQFRVEEDVFKFMTRGKYCNAMTLKCIKIVANHIAMLARDNYITIARPK